MQKIAASLPDVITHYQLLAEAASVLGMSPDVLPKVEIIYEDAGCVFLKEGLPFPIRELTVPNEPLVQKLIDGNCWGEDVESCEARKELAKTLSGEELEAAGNGEEGSEDVVKSGKRKRGKKRTPEQVLETFAGQIQRRVEARRMMEEWHQHFERFCKPKLFVGLSEEIE